VGGWEHRGCVQGIGVVVSAGAYIVGGVLCDVLCVGVPGRAGHRCQNVRGMGCRCWGIGGVQELYRKFTGPTGCMGELAA